jgi:hypothetical protein
MWRVVKVVRWDANDAIIHEPLRTRSTNLTQPNLEMFTGDTRMYAFSDQRMVVGIFMKFCLNVVPR